MYTSWKDFLTAETLKKKHYLLLFYFSSKGENKWFILYSEVFRNNLGGGNSCVACYNKQVFYIHPHRESSFLESLLSSDVLEMHLSPWDLSGWLSAVIMTVGVEGCLSVCVLSQHVLLYIDTWAFRCGVNDTGVSFPPHLPCPDSQ